MVARLDALLADIAPARHREGLVDDLRAELRAAAEATCAGLDDGALPILLTKDRIGRVLACEAHAAATGGGDRVLSEPIVRGRVLDRLLHHHVHGDGPRPGGPALAVAEGAFEAERDDAVVEWLLDDPERRQRVAEDATAFADRLGDLGPVEPSWWPRCEDRIRVDLAGGAVRCTAQLDLVLGGAPTGHPHVLVEVKSGRFGQDHRDGLFWYALLATLRFGAPPAVVVGWSAWDGLAWTQVVTEPLLFGAVARTGDALHRLGALARGRLPTRTACAACAWCDLRDACPEARVDGDDD